MEVGNANGWNVWPLENGDWAWRTWVAGIGATPQSGVAASELEAEQAAQGALEHMVSDANAAAQDRRELAPPDTSGVPWRPEG